jgi:hypothetical protein
MPAASMQKATAVADPVSGAGALEPGGRLRARANEVVTTPVERTFDEATPANGSLSPWKR